MIWNDWGRAMEIGAETSAPEIADVAFEDCDIVRTTHIAMDIQHGNRAVVRDIRFQNIRVELDDYNPRPRIQVRKDETYDSHPTGGYYPQLAVVEIWKNYYSKDAQRGTVRDVLLRDIAVTAPRMPDSRLSGHDPEHTVEGITLRGLRFQGQPVRTLSEARMGVAPHVKDVRIAE